jgi:hypothetical protein
MTEQRDYEYIGDNSSENEFDDSEWKDYSDEWEDYCNSWENESEELDEPSSEEQEVSDFEDMSGSIESPPPPRKRPENWQKHHAPFPHNPYAKEAPQPPLYEPPPTCVICRRGRDFVGYRPCRHVIVCSTCTKQLTHCPLCRRAIDRTEMYVKQKLK